MNGEAEVMDHAIVRSRSRILDYAELMKPELTFLSVLSALCGFYLGSSGRFDLWLFVHTAVGTTLLGGGAGALNQYIERGYDALMKRTERRPLPAGRVQPMEVFLFGTIISIAGLVQLTVFTNPLTGFLGAITFATYLFLYTPLKRMTTLSTIIGTIPGALPPMMGWTAVRNELSPEAWALFAILVCWQMPHFLSLAWLYRKDYARAGYKMLTVVDQEGTRTGWHIVTYSMLLIPVSVIPTVLGMAGLIYACLAVCFGLAFLALGIQMLRTVGDNDPDRVTRVNFLARRVFFASLIYLPVLMLVMSLDKV